MITLSSLLGSCEGFFDFLVIFDFLLCFFFILFSKEGVRDFFRVLYPSNIAVMIFSRCCVKNQNIPIEKNLVHKFSMYLTT